MRGSTCGSLLLKRGRRWSWRGALLPKMGNYRITMLALFLKRGRRGWVSHTKNTWTTSLAWWLLNWPCDTTIHICRWCWSRPLIRAWASAWRGVFWCASQILSKLQAFLWEGPSLAFFWHYYVDNWEESNNQHFGVHSFECIPSTATVDNNKS